MEPIYNLELEGKKVNALDKFPLNPEDGQIVGPFMWNSERRSWMAYYE